MINTISKSYYIKSNCFNTLSNHPTCDSMPNDIFKRIKTDTMTIWTVMTSMSSNIANIFGYFDICKLIFGVF